MTKASVVVSVGAVLGVALGGSVTAQIAQFHHVQGGHIEGVEFVGSSRGWTIEDGARIRFTTNGGADWSPATTPTDPETWVQLNGIFVMDLGSNMYKVWAVGEDGVVLVSTDTAGQVFGDANPESRVLNRVGEGDPCETVGQRAKLHDIFMIDEQTGWLVGEEGVLRYTDDGGTTWWDGSEVNTPFEFAAPSFFNCDPDPYDAYVIHFFADSDYEKGIIGSEFGKIFLTEDAGATWTVKGFQTLEPCPDLIANLEFWGLDFADPDDPDSVTWLSGGMGSGAGYVFKRSANWSTGTWSQLRCYDFLQPSQIDFGGTCTLSTIYSLSVLDGASNRVILAGYAGQLFDWLNGTADFKPCECDVGQPSECGTNVPTWVQQNTNPDISPGDPCTPRGAYFGSARVGSDSAIAVGDFGRITLYDDGASNETVELGSVHFTRLLDGKFFDDTNGIVVGQRNSIYATDDAGESWDLVGDFSTCGTNDNLNAVDFSDDGQYGVAVGNNGLLVYSNNGGASWSSYSWPSPGVTSHLTGVDFVPSSQTVFVIGLGGFIKKSTNGGSFWRDVTSPGSTDLYGVSFASGGNDGFVVGASKTAYRTTTAGTSWAAVTVNGGASEILWDVETWDGTEAIAVGDSGRVFEKTGSTFEQIDDDTGFPSGITQPLLDVETLNDGDNIRIGGIGGVVLFRDSGTWSRVRSDTSLSTVKLSFPTADEGFAIGWAFYIAHYYE